jgi:hypothetical protein
MYSVDAIDPTANGRVYQDDVVVYYRDDDATDELHLQIDNNDATLNMSFTIEIDAEVFETGVGGGGGDVVGPGSAVDSSIALFDSTTGKLIKDSAVSIEAARAHQEPIINGFFDVWQRGTSFTAVSNDVKNADRFSMNLVNPVAVIDVSRLTLADATIETATGQRIPYAYRVTVATQDATTNAGDFGAVFMKIAADEMISFLHREFTISFWVRSSVTGTYAFACSNHGGNQQYIKTFTIDSANTWERKSITVPVQSSGTGTWNYTTGTGLACRWVLTSGTDFHGTDDAWQTPADFTTASQTNLFETLNATFDITGIQMDLGPTALPLRYVSFDETMRRCLRYYQKSYDYDVALAAVTEVGAERFKAHTTAHNGSVRFLIPMRDNPTIVAYETSAGATGNWRDTTAGANRVFSTSSIGMHGFSYSLASTVDGNVVAGHWTADAELA